MWNLHKSTIVTVPYTDAYAQWAELEGMPCAVSDAGGAQELRYARIRWSDVGHVPSPAALSITVRRSSQRIACRCVNEGRIATAVAFDRVSDAMTRVTMRVTAIDGREPSPATAYASEQEVQGSLRRLERSVEVRHAERPGAVGDGAGRSLPAGRVPRPIPFFKSCDFRRLRGDRPRLAGGAR